MGASAVWRKGAGVAANIELIRGIYDAFDRQDAAGALAALAPGEFVAQGEKAVAL